MSKISISAKNPVSEISIIKLVSSITNLSLGSAKKKLSEGKQSIFYTCELFLNDHKEHDSKIRKVVAEFARLNHELFVMEISHDESWSDVVIFDEHAISTEELINILDECVEDYK